MGVNRDSQSEVVLVQPCRGTTPRRQSINRVVRARKSFVGMYTAAWVGSGLGHASLRYPLQTAADHLVSIQCHTTGQAGSYGHDLSQY